MLAVLAPAVQPNTSNNNNNVAVADSLSVSIETLPLSFGCDARNAARINAAALARERYFQCKSHQWLEIMLTS